MRRAIVSATALAATLACVAAAFADQPTGTPASYATPTKPSAPAAIVAGPDGNLWFVESALGAHAVARSTTAGTITEFAFSFGFDPSGVTAGVAGTSSAGALWATASDTDLGGLFKVAPNGAITAVFARVPRGVAALAGDSSGNVWVTAPQSQVDEVLGPNYTNVSAHPLDAPAKGVAAGPDGTTMWVTLPSKSEVESIAGNGTVTAHQFPTGVTGSLGQIVLGPDGNLWAGLSGTPSYVLRITPTGTMTAFPLPAIDSTSLLLGSVTHIVVPSGPAATPFAGASSGCAETFV